MILTEASPGSRGERPAPHHERSRSTESPDARGRCGGRVMTEIHGLFETHLTVGELNRSIQFYRNQLGLTLAAVFPERQAAFFWVGPCKSAMLGLWASGHGPQRIRLHTAFRTSVES